MENGALSTVIKPNKFGPFMEPLVSAIIAQVLRGLAYLHEQGVVHRDIKGANILTTREVCCTAIPVDEAEGAVVVPGLEGRRGCPGISDSTALGVWPRQPRAAHVRSRHMFARLTH